MRKLALLFFSNVHIQVREVTVIGSLIALHPGVDCGSSWETSQCQAVSYYCEEFFW